VVSFAPGETSKTITVNVQGDTTIEPNETFRVTLSDPTNGATIATTIAQGTIQNNDFTDLAIAATNANRPEGNSGSTPFTFTVTRLGNATGTNDVNWAVSGTGTTNSANGDDFVGGVFPSGVVSFALGETSKVITVNVQGDIAFEPVETFAITLSNPTNGATITTATAGGIIQNYNVVTLAISAANRPEGNSGSTPLTFTVTRFGLTSESTSVDWTVNGTGTNPATFADFVGSGEFCSVGNR
jgi:hypothetical protein